MAEIIDDFPPVHRNTRGKYPWHEWGNGKSWLLKRGEDYTVDDESFRASVYRYARKNQLRAITVRVKGGVKVRFEPRPSPVKKIKKFKKK